MWRFELPESDSEPSEEPAPVEKVCDKPVTQYEFQCPSCSFKTTSVILYKRHEKEHRNGNRTPCPICEKPVTKVNEHMEIHSHDKKITCKECGKVSKNLSAYRTHSMYHIPQDSVCSVCGMNFQFKGPYLKHMSVHNEQQKEIKCTYCDAIFHRKCTLQKHLNTHTGYRPCTCEFCKRKFSSTDALKMHVRLHTKEKPYKCQQCSCAYPQRVSLRNHMRNKHNVILPKRIKY